MSADLNDKLELESKGSYFNSLSEGECNKQLSLGMNKILSTYISSFKTSLL